jgi:hypothetical protein
MMRRSFAALLLLAFALPLRADPPPLSREDFAHAQALVTKPGLPVQTLLVPIEIYRDAVSPYLYDLRVLDAAGNFVPHATRRLGDGEPWHRAQLSATDAGACVFDLDAPERDVIDLELAVDSYTGKRFADESQHGARQVPVLIEASDDLARFEPLLRTYVEQDDTYETTLIALPRARPRYLRVRWHADETFRIAGARFRLARDNDARMRITGTARAPSDGAHNDVLYDFDLGAQVLTRRLQVVLPVNARVHASLAGARADQSDRRQESNARRKLDTLYEGPIARSTRNGQALLSEPIRTNVYYRYLTLRVHEQAAPFAAPPELIVDYETEQLVFSSLTRGPFELVFGSDRAPPTQFSADVLLAMLSGDVRRALALSTVKLGKRKTIATRTLPAAPPTTRSFNLTTGKEILPVR